MPYLLLSGRFSKMTLHKITMNAVEKQTNISSAKKILEYKNKANKVRMCNSNRSFFLLRFSFISEKLFEKRKS